MSDQLSFDFTDENIDENATIMDINRVLEERVLRQFDLVGSFSDVDRRWMAIARTHIEQAFMAVERAVIKRDRIEGDLSKFN